jgi:hypothetical protein
LAQWGRVDVSVSMDAAVEGTSRDWERRCVGCGHLLRGLTSDRCPECGKPFDPNSHFPQRVLELLTPITWPARAARNRMILLVMVEAILWPPAWLALIAWLCIYCSIMVPVWSRDHTRRAAIKRYNIVDADKNDESAMLWRARRWLAVGLLLTLFDVPKVTAFAIEFPWISKNVHRLYEQEPAIGPHKWNWCGLQPISALQVDPTGVSFALGMSGFYYCGIPPQYGLNGSWDHIYGRWWYWDPPEMDDELDFFLYHYRRI